MADVLLKEGHPHILCNPMCSRSKGRLPSAEGITLSEYIHMSTCRHCTDTSQRVYLQTKREATPGGKADLHWGQAVCSMQGDG